MKKWENPELMILGAEKTENIDELGNGNGNGNNRPEGCFCDVVGNGHRHGAEGQTKWCPCCGGGNKPNPS
ncbi:hypothetical protein FHH43_13305 [Clostridium perfringens]|nr:hypothetical protein [Clostridium perfringens]